MRDRDVVFHKTWLGFAEPIEGLVFSVPVLADAQIAPEVSAEITTRFEAQLAAGEPPRIERLARFFREFLGYGAPGMLVPRSELPKELSFYAAEGGQEIVPSFALGRGPFGDDDPFATFAPKAPAVEAKPTSPYWALLWDLTESGRDLDLDEPEAVTGPWRYPPTAKLERLLRHSGVPVGFLFNGRELRLVYAPADQTTGHLTFRVEHLARSDGRPLLAALELLLHARRAYSASPEHTLEGLLAESRRRQADVTDDLAKQVFEAVELLTAGFEAAAARDAGGDGSADWLRAALEEPNDHFYQGILSVVLRLVFVLYAEDSSLLPVEDRTFAQHLSLFGLHARLTNDAGAHPESMHHRFGAYGQLLSLFRTVFFGVKHGALELPPRRGRLFDPNAYPFLEGGLPGWTSAVVDPASRAAARPPSLDDGTIYRVLQRLVVFEGQRLSYRTLDVEQIGSVYESLMGFHVLRVESPAVRMGKHGVWVESHAIRAMSASDRAKYLKETVGLGTGPAQSLEKALRDAKDEAAVSAALEAVRKGDEQHCAAAGRLVLQAGEERRRTASHYTPRSLTEKVVRRTLEPLLGCLGPERTPEQILQLKICDPAMGSGAFLVATCRELASEIVAAWTRAGTLARVIEEHGNAHLHARRLVAQKCLYGVDKNAAAVELAKLSLWLVTLSKTLPFTFVDHALRHGDSLVGLDFKQIESFHWAPSKQTETCRVLLREALDQAVALRQELLELADHDDPVSQGEKRRLFDFAQQAIDRVRIVADACVGAFFAETKDAAREKERKRRLALVEQWLAGNAEAGAELETLARDARAKLAPFHWWIEFPEVFFEERPDPLQGGAVNGAAVMDGCVGNPPFLGQKDISGTLGACYRDWLFQVHAGSGGKSDLAAHFFRRAAGLLGRHGTLGFVATDKISQGDTRISGLQHLLTEGFVVLDAVPTMVWPGGASVSVATAVLAVGRAAAVGTVRRINGVPAAEINSRLREGPEQRDPQPLAENAEVSFRGCELAGQGFILTESERREAVAADPHSAERIFRFLGGDDVNTSPTQGSDRFVIDFGQMSLQEAAQWPVLIDRVRSEVKRERDGANRASRRLNWWRFGEVQPAMRAAIASLDRCLVIARDPQHFCFSFQPTGDRVFSEKLYVLGSRQMSTFAVLQSRVHLGWATVLGRTTGVSGTHSYSNTRCFETFPFPRPDPRAVITALETSGQTLYDARAKYMVDTDQGLTKTYNALKDPACTDARVLELRRLHEAMDRAVLDAYGWTDLAVPPYCPLNEAGKRALQQFEDEVIDRLYVLNAERAREEERLGPAAKHASAKTPAEPAKPKKAKTKKPPGDQGKLF